MSSIRQARADQVYLEISQRSPSRLDEEMDAAASCWQLKGLSPCFALRRNRWDQLCLGQVFRSDSDDLASFDIFSPGHP